MPESWTLSVGPRVYGPYTVSQMQALYAEGRLARHSLVARADEEQFHAASENRRLAELFQRPTDVIVGSAPEPVKPNRSTVLGQNDVGTRALGDFVIVAEMKSYSTTNLEAEILLLGPAHRIGAQVWLLSSEDSINTIRSALVMKLGKLDTLFIVDATQNKAAWFNFAPEADCRLRSIWHRQPAHSGKKQRNFGPA